MRAATYVGEERFVVEDRPAAPPGPGEVRLDVAYVGICGTDLHIKHGAMDQRVSIPAVIGHEMSGRIGAVGPGVGDWSVGDPVTVMPLDWCGACSACRAGHQHVCENLVFVGIDAAGAMQQSWTIGQHLLVALPREVSLQHAALTEPVAVAVHDVRRAQLRPGERALVVGGGPIGLLIAAVAEAGGAEVLVSEPNPYRRAVAEQMGLRTVNPVTETLGTVVETWAPGGADVAFEVSGAPEGLNGATHALRVRGRLVVVAIHTKPVAVDLMRVFWRELTLVGARVYERRDFEQAVAMVADGRIPADAFISAIEPLDRTAEAFATLEAGGDVMKVLIDCRTAAP